ncbi:hypothetical protein DPMN_001104 [Dreissena polymorpha]|uniref:Uncharacterized protein n=1 Tax=Dreissena polymorpha TaxID=45954 RepID=A0A9D4ML39_DREPO|nr:hypothetical protein DPMN_001104 [Dreissena polymorpha]
MCTKIAHLMECRFTPQSKIQQVDFKHRRQSTVTWTLDDNPDMSHTYSSLAFNAAGIMPDTSHTYTYLDPNAMGDKSDQSNTYTSLANNAV